MNDRSWLTATNGNNFQLNEASNLCGNPHR